MHHLFMEFNIAKSKKQREATGSIPNVYEGILICNDSGVIKQATQVAADILGFRIDDLQGKKVKTLLHKNDRAAYDEVFGVVSSKKDISRNLIRRFHHAGGHYLWLECRLTNWLDQEDVAGIVINFKDVTEQFEAFSQQQAVQQELLNSHNFLENVINTVAAPIFVKDSKHRWVLFNNAFLQERKSSSVLGKSDYDFMPRNIADRIWKVDSQILKTGETVTIEEVIPMGKDNLRTVITTKSRFIDDKGEKFIIGFIMDITDRKRFENIIKNFNAQLRAVIESTRDQIFALDLKKNYTMFNQAHAETIKQLSGEDIKVGDNLLMVVPNELVPILKREIKKAIELGEFSSEVKLPNKVIFKVAYKAIRDDRGVATGVAVFAEDITERKLTEIKLRALNEELTQQNWQLASGEEELRLTLDQLSERNFELDQLMYKTSHDLRSPLSSILGLVNLTKLDPDHKNISSYLQMIEGRIKKLDEFINSMLNYGRVNRGEIKVTKINLREAITNAVHQLENLSNYKLVKPKITIKNETNSFNNDVLIVNIILSNIISNAYKYYNPEVESFLKIWVDIGPVSTLLHFKDNGIGIQEEHMDKIFNMFYRATDRSQGSGLGMYIVKQAVEKVNGTITLKSNYGYGTEIKIVLPNL